MKRIPPTEGIFKGQPFADYLNSEAWSSSDLRTLDAESEGCPALLKFKRDNPEDADKECFLLGRALHSYVLEDRTEWQIQPAEYTNEKSEIKPWNNNAKVCRQWYADRAGIDILTQKQEDDVYAWGKAIMANEAASKLLNQDGYAEVTCIAQCPETGLWLRSRVDFLPTDAPFLADIKTALDVSPVGFGKSAAALHYECQAWLYLYIYNLLAAKNGLPPKTDWLHIAVRKSQPHFVRCYYMEKAHLRYGEKLMRKWMAQLATCIETNEWPEYAGASEVSPLVYPDWLERKLEREGLQ